MTKTSDILIRARALLARRAGWCQHALAKDYHGQCEVGVESRHAYRFCSVGAVNRAILESGDIGSIGHPAWDYLQRMVPPWTVSILNFNDAPGTKKKMVLEIFDRAIESALSAERDLETKNIPLPVRGVSEIMQEMRELETT